MKIKERKVIVESAVSMLIELSGNFIFDFTDIYSQPYDRDRKE